MSESSEIANRVHDQIAGINRVTLFPATSQRMIDTSVAGTTYIGVAAAGTATSDTKAWILERVVVSGTTIAITHATDAWDNILTASFS